MFSNMPDVIHITFKQLKYKLRVNSGLFIGLIMIQLFAMGISANGLYQSGTSMMKYKSITGDAIILFSAIWISTLIAGMKQSGNMDFVFPGNRLTSSLSSIGFLTAASLYAAITAQLSGYALKAVMYFTLLYTEDVVGKPINSLPVIIQSIYMVFLYLLLTSSIVYFIGVICKVHKVFMVIIPIFVFALIYYSVKLQIGYTKWLSEFIFLESNMGIFSIKILTISVIIFLLSTFIYNRLEVRS